MQEKLLIAALGGLLHDVGKLVQRSKPDPWKKPETYQDEDVPVHAAWSGQFIWNSIPELWRGDVLHAMYHHKPEASPAQDKSLSNLIALADKLSAGERSDLEQTGKRQFPMQQLSIFDSISLSDKKKRERENYLPLSTLSLEESIIQPGEAMSGTQQREAYARLVETLESEIEDMNSNSEHNLEAYLEMMLNAVQRNTWCVPSAYYYSKPDVSLYDHSRMTAALAVCLMDLENEQIRLLLDAIKKDFAEHGKKDPPAILAQDAVLLVGGDISGIQDFIYTVSSKNAAKSLRGRSFYLQLLTEAVLRYVLRELQLPYTNVIYSGGGHFYLLAPLSAEEKMTDIQKQITMKLLKHHGTDLYLALGCSTVPYSGFKAGQFPIYWEQMHRELKRAKQRRYAELGADMYKYIFLPAQHGGNREKLCSVCGQEREIVHELIEEDPEDKICALCESFADQLGTPLTQSKFLLLGFGEPQPQEPGTALSALAEFGMTAAFLESKYSKIQWLSDAIRPEKTISWAFDDVDRWPKIEDFPVINQLRYTVNRIPEMTFDELQEKSTGIPRLGVLRMDVDNLGMIFQKGFGAKPEDSIATLARISTLSFQMSLFFEGWIKKITERYATDDGKPLIYSVYAGGDDVFLIGPWDRMPKIAMQINKDFASYTGYNPDLHISGGMTFIHGKYPVYQAADDAGNALDDHAKAKDGKSAFAFLDSVWKWDEFEEVENMHTDLIRVMEMPGAPHALLQQLQRLADAETNKKDPTNEKRVWGPWMWIGDYQLTRMIERASGELQNELKNIHIQLKKTIYEDIYDWGKVARWVQLEIRGD